jgi:pilus assembly protein CpaE
MSPRRITAILVHDGSVDVHAIIGHIPSESLIEIIEVVDTVFPATDAVKASQADVLLVGCAEGSIDALNLVEWWSSVRVGRPIVVVTTGSQNGFVEGAFAAGADDLVVLDPDGTLSEPTARHIVFSLQKAVARRSGPADLTEAEGKLIVVLGPKGGIGKTMTCCNLAVALAQRGRSVVLVDLDLQFGDVALSLGMTPETTSYDLAVSGGALDSHKIDAFLLRHSSGLRVLAAPVRPDQADSVTSELLADVYDLLRQDYEFIVVDTPPAFTPQVIASIDVSTFVCMVGMLDALSLKNTRLGMETLDLMGYEADRVRIVLNRANTAVGITRSDVVSILGRAPDILVPSHRDIARSVNEGAPVVISQRRSEAARAFDSLASLFSAPAVSSPTRRNRSLMRRS